MTTAHETFTADWAGKKLVSVVLSLGWVATVTTLMLATHLSLRFGGTPRQQLLALGLVTAIPFALAYWPLSRLLSSHLKQALSRR